MEQQSVVVYSIPCEDYDALYVGKSGRKLEKRLNEHKSKAASSNSAIKEHIDRSRGHQIAWDNVMVLKREPKDFSRRVLRMII